MPTSISTIRNQLDNFDITSDGLDRLKLLLDEFFTTDNHERGVDNAASNI